MHSCHRGCLALFLVSLIASPPLSADSISSFSTAGQADSPDGDPVVRTITAQPGTIALPRPNAARRAGTVFMTETHTTAIGPEGDLPMAARFTPDGARIVIAHRDSRNLVVFDAATRLVVDVVALSGSPNDLAVSSDGVHAVTANVFENTASIVDLSTGDEVAVVPVGEQPGVVRITPDGLVAAVGNTVDGNVSVLDIGTATELRRIAGLGFVGTYSFGIENGAVTAAFSPFELASNTMLVHPDFFAGQVRFADLTTGAVTSLPVSANPREVAITPDGSKAVVSHTGAATVVTEIDVASKSILDVINAGTAPTGPISINPAGTKAVVAVLNACRVVNLVTNTASSDLATLSVNALATTADGNHALTIGFQGSLIAYATETIVANLNGVVSTAAGAVSPAGPRGAMIANTFGEDLVVVNTNGAAGFREGVVPTGPLPEADRSRIAAIGEPLFEPRVAVTNILSDNVSLIRSGVEAIVATGDRPAEVEFTPDGGRVVVANLDASFVSVIDFETHAVTNVTISTRGSQVEISPNGRYAYVAVVASGDGVWRVDLDALAVSGPKLPTGNMGSIGFSFGQTSGLTLSHDGATLVTCNSFDHTISIIDTASWSVVKTLAVGTFPVRAIFSADDTKIYVSNRDNDRISEVSNLGAGSVVTRTFLVSDQPFELAMLPNGSKLYVSHGGVNTIGVIDVASGTMTSSIPVDHPIAGLGLHESDLPVVADGALSLSVGPGPVFAISESGELNAFDAGSFDIGLPPSMLRATGTTRLHGVAPFPTGDRVEVFFLDPPIAVEEIPTVRGDARAWLVQNPTRERATFRLVLGQSAEVAVSIWDAGGRLVRRLDPAALDAGENDVTWDGRDERGGWAEPGVYFARLTAGSWSTALQFLLAP